MQQVTGTGNGDDVIILVRLPHLIIVVQQDGAICPTVAGEELELVMNFKHLLLLHHRQSPAGPWPWADGNQHTPPT